MGYVGTIYIKDIYDEIMEEHMVRLDCKNKYEVAMFIMLVVYAFAVSLSTSVVSICIVAGFIIMICQFIKTGKVPTANMEIAIVAGVYFFLSLLSAILSPTAIESVKEWFANSYRFLPFIWGVMYIKTRNQIKFITVAFLCAVFVECVVAITQEVQLYSLVTGGRVAGLTDNPNILAAILLMYIIFLQNVFFQKYDIKYIDKIIILGLVGCIVSLLFTMSRAGCLGLIFLLLISGFLYKFNRKTILILAISSIIGVGGILTLFPAYYQRMSTVSDMNMSSNIARVYIWHDTVEMIMDHPVVGIGRGNYSDVFNNSYASDELLKLEKNGVLHAHNNLLMVTAEGGLISLMGYVVFYLYTFSFFVRNVYLNKKRNSSAIMGILLLSSIQLTGVVDMNVYNNHIMRIFFFLLAIAVTGIDIEKYERKK